MLKATDVVATAEPHTGTEYVLTVAKSYQERFNTSVSARAFRRERYITSVSTRHRLELDALRFR